MGRFIRINVILLISFVLVSIYLNLTSCKKIANPNSGKDVKDTILYEQLKTRIFIQFIDANTIENIVPDNGTYISTSIVGSSKDAVVDIIGMQKDQYSPKNGFLTLSLFPEYIPSANSPICFTIISQLQNYLSSSKEVIITSDGDYYIKIPMVNIEDPPPSVTINHEAGVGNLYNGVVHQSISITSTNGDAIITIPAGAKLLDTDTNELKGKLNLTLVQYSTENDKSLSVIPGGISSSILKNNSTVPVVFFPANVLSFSITDSEYTKAAIVEDGMLDIEIKIPNNSYNPNTYSSYKMGDEIELFSYLPDSGLWNYELTNSISNNSSGLSLNTSTNSIGSYNFSNYLVSDCYDGSIFNISGDCQEHESLLLEGVLRKQDDDTFISSLCIPSFWNKDLKIPTTTGGTNVYIDWNNANECSPCVVDPIISPLLIDDMCSIQTINLPLVNNSQITTSIIARFSGVCPSDTNYLILPSFGVWTRHIDSQCWNWSSMNAGTSQISNLTSGETYIIGTYFNDKWQQWEVTIGIEEDYKFIIKFPESVCKDVFGIL